MMTVWNHRPLISQDSVFGREIRLYNEWLEHDTFDDYWERAELNKQDFDNINLPVLHLTGWFDGAMLGAMHFWNGMHQSSNKKENQYIVIGPWDHAQVYLDGAKKMGEIELGDNSILDMKKIHLEFFDAFLKTPSNGYDKPKARLFITGTNEWKEFDNYPPKEINTKNLYLQSQGSANSKNGNGSLTWDMSAKNYVDTFTFDPKNPTPGEFNSGVDCGKHEDRKDVLVYSSQGLTEPLTIVGNVSVTLYASSNARDVDFIARLIDVYPDGKAINIGTLTSGGIIRARYRNGYQKTELLTPNEPTKLEIDLYGFGHTFLQGHQIRLEISSGAFPVYCPNQNTGNPVATDTEWEIAHQTIYHDKNRPSHIVLPIMKK
jgi:putative CocE/NonD family hydrolase